MKNSHLSNVSWLLFLFVFPFTARGQNKAVSSFMSDETPIRFYATGDTSTVNAARALALLKLDYEQRLLDSFFYFHRAFRPVETLLDDNKLWDANFYVSNKTIIVCAREYYLRTFYYQAFSVEIERLSTENCLQTVRFLTLHRDNYFTDRLGAKSMLNDLPSAWQSGKSNNVTALSDRLRNREAELRGKGFGNSVLNDSLSIYTPENTFYRENIGSAEYGGNRTSVPISIPSLSEQNLIWGVSSFIAERFKIELQLAFFDKMQRNFKDTDAHLLFPETTRLLNIDVLSEKISNVRHTANISTSFQVALETDLQNMTENTLLMLQSEKFTDRIVSQNPDSRDKIRYLQGCLALMQRLRSGDDATDAIAFIAQAYPYSQRSDFDAHINFLWLILKNVQSTNKNVRTFLSENDFKQLLQEPLSPRYFVALLFHQQESLFENLNIGSKVLRTRGESILTPVASLLKMVNRGNDLVKSMKTNSNEQNVETYSSYLAALVEALEETVRVSSDVRNKAASEDFTKWIAIFKGIGGSAKAIRERNYAVVLNNTVAILEQLTNMADVTVKSDYQKLTANVSFYGAFGCDLLKAGNDADVKNVLNNYTLPVGSYRHKRMGGQNIYLNIYAGGFFGGERLRLENRNYDSVQTVVGFSAPIGIDYSWTSRRGSSNSFFLSIIDLGSIVSYRLGGGPVYAQPALKFENLIAPGVTFYHHFHKLPISIGAGVQMSPRLRQLTADAALINANFAMRGGISLMVDIPAFRISSF